MMKKQMIDNAEEMKKIFRELAPDLVEDGTIHLEIDHKSISKETQDQEKHGFGIIAVIHSEEVHERYMMAFKATDKTDTATNVVLLESCLEVEDFFILFFIKFFRNLVCLRLGMKKR